MAKSFTKEEVEEKIAAAAEKNINTGFKAAQKRAIQACKDELDVIKDGDGDKAEKKAAIAAVKNVIDRIKSPVE